jgi:hypothetical protein
VPVLRYLVRKNFKFVPDYEGAKASPESWDAVVNAWDYDVLHKAYRAEVAEADKLHRRYVYALVAVVAFASTAAVFAALWIRG